MRALLEMLGHTTLRCLGTACLVGLFLSLESAAMPTLRLVLEQPISSLAVDPQDPANLYALSSDNSLFVSRDGGQNWTEGTLPDVAIRSLSLDPLSPRTLYAFAVRQTFKSEDAGATWTDAALPQSRPPSLISAADPQDFRVFFQIDTAENQLRLSDDAGESWQPIEQSRHVFNDIAFDPSNERILYAATSDGVYRSDNGGGAWQHLALKEQSLRGIHFDPQNPQTLYSSAGLGLLKSIDGGQNWAPTGLVDERINRLAINPQAPQTLYAGTGAGVFKSLNGGQTWTAAGLPEAWVSHLAIDPQAPQTLYAGTSAGVFKSLNSGQDWTETGFAGLEVRSLSLSAPDPQTMYAVVYFPADDEDRLFKSADGGQTWTGLTVIDTRQPLAAVVADPQLPEALYALSPAGLLLQSEDGGETWRSVGVREHPAAALAVNPKDSSRLLMLSQSAGVFLSRDRGAGWRHVYQPSDGVLLSGAQALVIDASDGQRLYLTTADGVFSSGDGGQSWVPIFGLDALSDYSIAVDRADPRILHVVNEGRLFLSFDRGAIWIRTPLSSPSPIAVSRHPQEAEALYAGTQEGLFETVDGGSNWTRLDLDGPVSDLVLSASDAGRIYALGSAGLYAAEFGNGTWIAEDVGLPNTTALYPNYPNPFNGSTLITYRLGQDGEVHLDVFDAAGQKVKSLVRGFWPAGTYGVHWDGRDDKGRAAASGVYFTRLQDSPTLKFTKMLLVK